VVFLFTKRGIGSFWRVCLRIIKIRLIYVALLAAMGTFCGSRVSAQDATGRVTGVIYDPSGAVVADAHISVTNVATHTARYTTSDSAGFYQVLALPIGYYTVSVAHQGLRSETTAQSKLEINQTLKVDLKCKSGQRVIR
jgi:hypothetical protein